MHHAFTPFPKIARFNRTVIVTEKIDGTNASIEIVQNLYPAEDREFVIAERTDEKGSLTMYAGSRNRFVTPEKDNYGFASWVKEHADMLFRLGPGRHYGEWWGSGIQRGYGLVNGEKRFSLFNVHRWKDGMPEGVPCSVVPVLGQRTLDTLDVNGMLDTLRVTGSVAAPGFMDPEGIIMFHTASSTLYKYTLDGDGHKESK
jgi:hypothetical protein